jgi:hypothetical protein
MVIGLPAGGFCMPPAFAPEQGGVRIPAGRSCECGPFPSSRMLTLATTDIRSKRARSDRRVEGGVEACLSGSASAPSFTLLSFFPIYPPVSPLASTRRIFFVTTSHHVEGAADSTLKGST